MVDYEDPKKEEIKAIDNKLIKTSISLRNTHNYLLEAIGMADAVESILLLDVIEQVAKVKQRVDTILSARNSA